MTMFGKQQKFQTPDWFVKVLPLFGLFVQDRIKKENALLLAHCRLGKPHERISILWCVA